MNSSILKEFIDYVADILDISDNDKHSLTMIANFIHIINSDDDFPVNLEDVIQWLDVYAHGLRNTLEKSYTLGVDYVQHYSNNISNGRPKYIIYISNDCFKQLCLKTKSKYGDLIRKYFIIIEKMYREYMLTGILNRQRSDKDEYVEKQYVKTDFPVGNCLYVLRILNKKRIYYGIGFTNNLNRRLSEHRRTIPGKIDVVLQELYKHHIFLESCVHRFLEKFKRPMHALDGHKLTEIFETDIDKIRQIIIHCRNFSQSPEMLALIN